MKLGIDAIAVYVPKLYMSLTGEWAGKRANIFANGNEADLIAKVEKGVGVVKMSIPDVHEDPATMAAMAIKKLIDSQNISLNDIGHIAVASETGIDQSKSIASYVLGMLESYYSIKCSNIGCIEYKFACVSSSYALESVLALMKSGMITKKYSIVVSTDIAKYDLESAGEYTQGAGAVAMLISESPRLLSISEGAFGTYSADERDFFRPNWSDTPVVDGKYSMDVYCECMLGAFRNFIENKSISCSENILEKFQYMIFHVPFPKMAEHAASRLLLPLISSRDESEISKEEYKSYRKSDEFRKVFSKITAPSLEVPRDVGNIYTGSIFLSLVSLLESSRENNIELENSNIVFSAYGSGSSSKVFSGTFEKKWKESISKNNLLLELKDVSEGGLRKEITYDEYEKIHSNIGIKSDILRIVKESSDFNDKDELVGHLRNLFNIKESKLTESVVRPTSEFIFSKYGSENSSSKIDVGLRYYKYIN